MGRDPVKNRAHQAAHRQRAKERRERTIDIMGEFTQYVKRDPSQDAAGQFAYRVQVPEAFYQRFEELAQEHGMTAQELLDDSMMTYLLEVQRLKDEQN